MVDTWTFVTIHFELMHAVYHLRLGGYEARTHDLQIDACSVLFKTREKLLLLATQIGSILKELASGYLRV